VHSADLVGRSTLAHAKAQVFDVRICLVFRHVEDRVVSREEYCTSIPLAVWVGIGVWEDGKVASTWICEDISFNKEVTQAKSERLCSLAVTVILL